MSGKEGQERAREKGSRGEWTDGNGTYPDNLREFKLYIGRDLGNGDAGAGYVA